MSSRSKCGVEDYVLSINLTKRARSELSTYFDHSSSSLDIVDAI